jgi:FkbM family methyltransferase
LLAGCHVKNKVINAAWRIGIRAFRLARKVGLSTILESAFARAARIVPATTQASVATLPNGDKLWMPAGYRDTRTVATGLFQEDETRLFQRLARPGMTFVDIGAYVGYFTILASGLVGATGRVYAFEPERLAYDYLLRNIATNDCNNAIAINRAASDGTKTAALIRDPTGPESFVANAPVAGDSVIIQTVSLDSFFDTEGWPSVDLVKMNIEGAELQALRGLKEVSLRNPALQLVMEFNPTAMQRANISREDLTLALRGLGFRHAQIVERGLEDIPSGDLLPRGGVVYNILLTK